MGASFSLSLGSDSTGKDQNQPRSRHLARLVQRPPSLAQRERTVQSLGFLRVCRISDITCGLIPEQTWAPPLPYLVSFKD